MWAGGFGRRSKYRAVPQPSAAHPDPRPGLHSYTGGGGCVVDVRLRRVGGEVLGEVHSVHAVPAQGGILARRTRTSSAARYIPNIARIPHKPYRSYIYHTYHGLVSTYYIHRSALFAVQSEECRIHERHASVQSVHSGHIPAPSVQYHSCPVHPQFKRRSRKHGLQRVPGTLILPCTRQCAPIVAPSATVGVRATVAALTSYRRSLRCSSSGGGYNTSSGRTATLRAFRVPVVRERA